MKKLEDLLKETVKIVKWKPGEKQYHACSQFDYYDVYDPDEEAIRNARAREREWVDSLYRDKKNNKVRKYTKHKHK